jgi:CP family cyanate transporter-like MFS transporter
MYQEREFQNPWLMLACAWLMGFAMYVFMLSVPPIIHIIMRDLRLTYAQAGLIFAAPLMMLAAFAIPSGILADRIGIRKAAGIGIAIIILGSLLRGTASNFETLLAFTCIYGAGFGLVYPHLPKLVGTWFPPGFAVRFFQRVGETLISKRPVSLDKERLFKLSAS